MGADSGPGHRDSDHVRQLREQEDVLPFERILAEARKRHPDARLVEVELKREDGRHLYEVELIDAGGTFRELYFDARTGELLSSEIEE
ncbi:hypothetical protein AN478_09480 [Thiohalorhabdus denitrificans]|nr:hypothetical protein AN478_09480 [Thiohalorhabdus denitrificans]